MMSTIKVEDETMADIEKVKDELCTQLMLKNVSKDRVVRELLMVYRQSHPEPPKPEPEERSKRSKSKKRTGKPHLEFPSSSQ